jgi:hypothetical protein
VKRTLALAAGITAAVIGWKLRSDLACRLGFRRHDPERVLTAAGPAYRCKRCGKKDTSAARLLDPHEEDGVRLDRPDQAARLHGWIEKDEPRRGRFLRGERWAR